MCNTIHHINKAEERHCVHFIEAFDRVYQRFSFVEVKFSNLTAFILFIRGAFPPPPLHSTHTHPSEKYKCMFVSPRWTMSTKGKHMRTADIQRNPTERVHFSVMVWLNGNPLQYSCLENPRDGGAWWASVYGVAQSQTQLKWLSSRSSSSGSKE